ncbi:hypothetical protein KUTeg_006897 [Tegillarca granosa]|uniref:Uncharacterized protein n=1 Tax=Tegillarca granosa TaxID=220873 RepID=A0ABQ9FE15_TEGGR|nr:hypothetical protein KUTeg_006897 [Tegillarca granosa]
MSFCFVYFCYLFVKCLFFLAIRYDEFVFGISKILNDIHYFINKNYLFNKIVCIFNLMFALFWSVTLKTADTYFFLFIIIIIIIYLCLFQENINILKKNIYDFVFNFPKNTVNQEIFAFLPLLH